MPYKNISKRKVKNYINYIEKQLEDKRNEIMQYNKENEEFEKKHPYGGLLYDLTEEYLREENLQGQLLAAKYILHNCYID